MGEMIMARDALNRLTQIGRPLREGASFLSEQCYELRLHGWAFVNTAALELMPHDMWPMLMWVALPDGNGLIQHQCDKLSILGSWLDGRISYRERTSEGGVRSYNIQGLRFDRAEFLSVTESLARRWFSEPIGALARPEHSDQNGREPGFLENRALPHDLPDSPKDIRTRRGRKVGTGFQRQDAPFVAAALALLRKGQAKSASAAAHMIVDQNPTGIEGASFHAKHKRLRKQISKLANNGV
jgi:hypothetical protein